ncbi:hypothetical protein BAY61_09570 [Prauserella marina]|nr:hypothetical protein BAY61_09570 [Prauserella marina]
MTRSVTKLAACALVLGLATAPGIANAQTAPEAVDEATGPVAYANVAALSIGEDGTGGSVITETQRSPLLPGTSRLAQSRAQLPGSDGEREAAGPHYLLDLGDFEQGDSPFPGREHDVTASLADTGVPSAATEADIALRDLDSGTTVLAMEEMRTSASCAGTDELSTEATAAKLWLLDEDGAELREARLPSGDQQAEYTGLPFGAPTEIDGAAEQTSDVVISRITSLEGLQRQQEWRGGDVDAAAGWQVRIVTHAKDAEGADLDDVTTTFVLGGVSCSLPAGFTQTTRESERPAEVVPVKIPAGPSDAGGQADSWNAWGVGLLGGGLALGAVAVAVALRRTPAPGSVRGEDG